MPTEWNQSENRIPQTSTISTTTHRDGVRWMQNLPQRSLRKARSGFLALRSGMQRHGHGPTRARSRGNIPGVWSSSDSGEGSLETEEFPSNVSEASTEEDFGFGTSLYRTLCNCSSALMGDPERYLLRGRSSITLIGLGRLPRLESESENSSSAPRTVDSSEDDDLDHQLARKLSMRNASKNHGHIAREASQRVSDSSGSGSRSGSGSGSSRPSISNIPRIGVNLQLEPLRLFGASREGNQPLSV